MTVSYLFPEYELVTEPEEDVAAADSDDGEEKSEEQKMQEYEAVMKSLQDQQAGVLQGGAVDKDLESMAMNESQVDKQFARFKKRIEKDPDQVGFC